MDDGIKRTNHDRSDVIQTVHGCSRDLAHLNNMLWQLLQLSNFEGPSQNHGESFGLVARGIHYVPKDPPNQPVSVSRIFSTMVCPRWNHNFKRMPPGIPMKTNVWFLFEIFWIIGFRLDLFSKATLHATPTDIKHVIYLPSIVALRHASPLRTLLSHQGAVCWALGICCTAIMPRLPWAAAYPTPVHGALCTGHVITTHWAQGPYSTARAFLAPYCTTGDTQSICDFWILGSSVCVRLLRIHIYIYVHTYTYIPYTYIYIICISLSSLSLSLSLSRSLGIILRFLSHIHGTPLTARACGRPRLGSCPMSLFTSQGRRQCGIEF